MSSPKYSVLLLDDSEDYQRILGRILRPAGYKILPAKSAEEAWQALEVRIPDAALVDWNLPGENGIAFARRMRQDPRFSQTILIMLTVNSRPEDQVQSLREGGFNTFMTKPVVPAELLARLESLLTRRAKS